MIGFTANLMLDVSILAWFTTTLVQVTLLASATLISSRLAHKKPAARHAILATGLVLILVFLPLQARRTLTTHRH